MNTVCQQCNKVEASGHHRCVADGESVLIWRYTPEQFRQIELDRYVWVGHKNTTAIEPLIRVSMKPVDSACADQYRGRMYGIS